MRSQTFPAVIVISLLAIILFIVYLLTRQSDKERLIKNVWCVESILYNNQPLQPHTVDFIMMRFQTQQPCDESVSFTEFGNINLPGFDGVSARGRWALKNDSLRISDTDTLSSIYGGYYGVDFSGNILVLKSKTTVIRCRELRLNLPF